MTTDKFVTLACFYRLINDRLWDDDLCRGKLACPYPTIYNFEQKNMTSLRGCCILYASYCIQLVRKFSFL